MVVGRVEAGRSQWVGETRVEHSPRLAAAEVVLGAGKSRLGDTFLTAAAVVGCMVAAVEAEVVVGVT